MALSSNCWKVLVLCFNILFAMSAVAVFVGSGFLLYRLFAYRHFIGSYAQYPVILLLMMSIITCSIAWIGWHTTRSMHYYHIILSGVLIFIVVAIEFGCFVWALVVWDNMELELKSTMRDYFTSTVQANEPNSIDALRWDKLHMKMKCCGVSGPGDYRAHTSRMPFSCCDQGPLDTLHAPYAGDCTTVFQRGCANQLHAYVQEQLLIVAATSLVACVLQSTGIFCTFFYASALMSRRRTSLRNSASARECALAAPDDSLLQSPSAPAPTLPKY